jgi:hypothetical protein
MDDNLIYRLSILGGILLCALTSGLLGDALLGVYGLDIGAAVPGGWRWLVGGPQQTFATQTRALLFGVALIGFALGALWFLAGVGMRWLRRR